MYATVDDLKQYLDEPGDLARYDELLEVCLSSATEAIDNYTDRFFGREDTAVTPAPSAKRFHPQSRYRLHARDFYSDTGFEVKVDRDGDGVYESTLDAADIVLGPVDRHAGEPWYLVDLATGVWPQSRRPVVEVTALWGWGEVPAVIHTTCLALAAEEFKRRQALFGVYGYSDLGEIRISAKAQPLMRIPDRLRRFPLLVA